MTNKLTKEQALQAIAQFDNVEIHLRCHDENFLRRFGKRVKAAGGKYSEMRGYADTRYVFLPATERDLINQIIVHEIEGRLAMAIDPEKAFRGKVVMIARGRHEAAGWHCGDPSWAIVHYFRADMTKTPMDFLDGKMAACALQMDRMGLLRPEPEMVPLPVPTATEMAVRLIDEADPNLDIKAIVAALERHARKLAKAHQALIWDAQLRGEETDPKLGEQLGRCEDTAAALLNLRVA
jgi:hypothetical protein